MPPDEKISKLIGIQKITRKYKDVNKNEVKFQWKVPVDMEYDNNKQKMKILITEEKSLLGMDWIKKFILTIGRIQLAKNSQFNRFLDLFANNETIKNTEIDIQLKPGLYPVKHKARPVPLYLEEDVGRELKRLKKYGHLE